jgi:hypothetical protein
VLSLLNLVTTTWMWKSISVRILRYLASGDLNLNWGSAFEDRETSVLFCFKWDVVPVYLRGAKMEREGEMDHGETLSFVVVDLFLDWENCLGCWRSLSQQSDSRKAERVQQAHQVPGLPKR